jgi:drug/metabolite transporter (DMT)-like permease
MDHGRPESEPVAREQSLLRIGGGCAILGAIVQVVAGTMFGNRAGESGAELLGVLAGQPDWYWSLAYLCFIAGAVLWVCAFVAIAALLGDSAGRNLGLLGLATIVIGATMHVVDAALNAGGLPPLAEAWRTASATDRGALAHDAESLRRILDGTWASVIMLFHGVPFVLSGLAVAFGRRFPWWLGWIGVIGGAGSLVAGLAMFFRLSWFPSGIYVPFAIVISVYMVIVGWYLWLRAEESVAATQERIG